MKLSTLCEGTDIQVRPEQDVEITGITDLSESVQPGDLFVCIHGKHVDGRVFAAQAQRKGAAAILTESKEEKAVPGFLYTADARRAYAILCGNYMGNPARRIQLTGVTGTNGKTTVTELLYQILEYTGICAGLIGTVENRIGFRSEPAEHTTPKPPELHSFFKRAQQAGCNSVIMEVSSQALDQQRLAGLHFFCAAFTNLTEEHLDYHETMEAYYQAKRKLFLICDHAVLNVDDPYGVRLSRELSVSMKTFALHNAKADYRIVGQTPTAEEMKFQLQTPQGNFSTQIPLIGEYNLSNGLCALVCAEIIGIPLVRAVEALAKVHPPKGRMEELPAANGARIFLDYAHTPDALQKVLQALRPFCMGGRLICLFGCGGERDRQKRPEMGRIASTYSDFIWLTNDNPREEPAEEILKEIQKGIFPGTSYRVIKDRVQAIQRAVAQLRPGDVLLLAGKGHEQTQTIGKQHFPFDERKIVAQALQGNIEAMDDGQKGSKTIEDTERK